MGRVLPGSSMPTEKTLEFLIGVRFVPEGGALVEATVRTIQSRLLLRPSPALNELVIGVLGRAQRLYEVACSCVCFRVESLSRIAIYQRCRAARPLHAVRR
jgi:hypothetical protein